MGKSNKTILIVAIILLLALIAMAWLSPARVNWAPTYNTKDKIPLGLYVFDQEVDSFFNSSVERIKYPLKEYFYEGIFEDSQLYDQTLLYINQDNHWTNDDVANICSFVRLGNDAFISSIHLPLTLTDSLDVMMVAVPFVPNFRQFNDTINVWLGDSLRTSIVDKNGLTGSYFIDYDTLKTTKLGFTKNNDLTVPNFIQIKHGEGHFYVHLEPSVFSNYHLLKDNHHLYTEKVLSNIPSYHYLIWSLNDQTSKVISDSPLRFILSQPALRWAWYLLLAGILMFVIFNIRRSQRIIPIIPKPTNTSVEFVKTIGNLYFMEGDIRSMIDKKIVYLLANIRNDFNLNTEVLDEKFVHLLQLKSGKDEEIVKKIIFLVNKHTETDYTCTLDDLNRLNAAIEHFYQ